MEGKWKVDWRGPQVQKHVERATVQGGNETMAACLVMAKALVRIEFAVLQGSIRIVNFATMASGKITGRWGSADVNYALWQEIGTSKMTAQPYLRPAADAEYPKLVGRIRAAFS